MACAFTAGAILRREDSCFTLDRLARGAAGKFLPVRQVARAGCPLQER